MGWVHASERLSLLHLGKASRGNAKVKTGIGKSDLPGLQGGPRKRDLVIYDKVRASRLYPDHVRYCESAGVQLPRATHPGHQANRDKFGISGWTPCIVEVAVG